MRLMDVGAGQWQAKNKTMRQRAVKVSHQSRYMSEKARPAPLVLADKRMQPYNKNLTTFARDLRTNQTAAEELLWSKLRRKQLLDAQFYRQKPLASYIVDFYCASARLVIELDGSQHFEADYQERDAERGRVLASLGLLVLRFDNLQVLKDTQAVLSVIYDAVEQRKN